MMYFYKLTHWHLFWGSIIQGQYLGPPNFSKTPSLLTFLLFAQQTWQKRQTQLKKQRLKVMWQCGVAWQQGSTSWLVNLSMFYMRSWRYNTISPLHSPSKILLCSIVPDMGCWIPHPANLSSIFDHRRCRCFSVFPKCQSNPKFILHSKVSDGKYEQDHPNYIQWVPLGLMKIR